MPFSGKTGTNWGGEYSRWMFDEAKAYMMVAKMMLEPGTHSGIPLLDAELNEQSEIFLQLLRRIVQRVFGDGTNNDGFKIIQSSSNPNNNFTIGGGDGTVPGAGSIFVKGWMPINFSNMEYTAQSFGPPALTTPSGGNRTDSVYIDVYYKEVDRVADSSIVDPTIGMETSRRIALAWEVRVVEGGSPPGKYVDANNIQHWTLKLATLNRLNGNAQITNAMIVDERNVNRMIALISELDAHANAFSVHGATNAATANRIILRDSVGRAQVAAPAAAADIARKDTVDAVQTNLNNHANLTAAHSATATPTANRIATFDANGRLKSAAAPNAADDVMRLADYTLAGLGITKTAAEINAVANGLAGDPIEIINPNSYNNITSSQTLASVALNNIGVGSIGLCIGFCSVGGSGGTGYYSCGARIASLSGDYIVRFLGGTPEGGVMLPNVSHAYNGSSFGADLSVCVPFIVHTLGSHTITFRFQPMSRPTSASFHIGANSKFALIWLNKQ